MSEVERSALVNFSAKQMFDLVNDVVRYSEFLPGCEATTIIEQSDVLMIAEMELKKGPISQTFTTRNTLLDGERIDIELLDGPFEYLHGHWHFKALNEIASKVEFDLSFKFSNQLIGAAFGRIFTELTAKMVDCFVARAAVVYAKKSESKSKLKGN